GGGGADRVHNEVGVAQGDGDAGEHRGVVRFRGAGGVGLEDLVIVVRRDRDRELPRAARAAGEVVAELPGASGSGLDGAVAAGGGVVGDGDGGQGFARRRVLDGDVVVPRAAGRGVSGVRVVPADNQAGAGLQPGCRVDAEVGDLEVGVRGEG